MVLETDEDKKIKKITDLLEKGGTMLANHHDCGAPMFRYKGNLLCPVCEFQEGNEHRVPKPATESVQITRVIDEGQKEVSLQKEGIDLRISALHDIAVSIEKKIHIIASELQNETDLQRLKDKMACIEQGIKILKLLDE